MKCQLCNQGWPARFVQTLFTNFGTIAVDPICALKEMREIHHNPSLEFHGENNRQLYAEAIAYMKEPR